MASWNAAADEARVAERLQPLADAMAALHAEYRARYATVLFHVRIGDGPALHGQVLLAAQRDEALRRARAIDAEVLDELQVLSDPEVAPLAWAVPANGRADVLRHPLADDAAAAIHDCASAEAVHLSTQATAEAPPMRVLAQDGAWRLVQLFDHTMGWVHAAQVREIDPPTAHPWRGQRHVGTAAALPVKIRVGDLLAEAESLLGTPYVLGGADPAIGLDCSGFVQRVYLKAAGIVIPKYTGNQRRVGVRVSRAEVAPGDLLFFKSRAENVSHVAMALQAGGERLIHASRRNNAVCVQSFEEVRAGYAYLGAKRMARFVEDRPTVRVEAVPARPVDLSDPESLRGHRVHVVGVAGAEGAAIVRFLVQHGVGGVVAHDFSTPDTFAHNFKLSHVGLKPRERVERLQELLSLPIELCYRDAYLRGVDTAEVVFVPQGWFLYESNAPLRSLRGAVISQMTDLYFRLSPCPIAAVSGTNGKSTTTRLLADLVEAGERPLLFAGNDRRNVQVLDRLKGFPREGLLVLEVSNRQLLDLDPHPHVAVVTNVTPDHVEEHGSFEAYAAAKRKLVARQGSADYAILNRDNPTAWSFAAATGARVLPFGLDPREGDGAWLRDGSLELRLDGHTDRLCAARELRLPGRHNVANVLAAAMAARVCGVEVETIRRVVREFQGIHLRLQTVDEIAGVRYVNDIKATTPEAAMAAVEAFDNPLLVIVGGGDKGLDYAALAERIVERACHLLVLDSDGGKRVAEAVRRAAAARGAAGPAIATFADLAAAVAACSALAQPGDVVLLSPACPGIFSMYMDDTKGFGALVRDLKKGTQ